MEPNTYETIEAAVNATNEMNKAYKSGSKTLEVCTLGLRAAERALALTPSSDSQRWDMLVEVSIWRYRLFKQDSESLTDLDEAISAVDQALQAVPTETDDYFSTALQLAEYLYEKIFCVFRFTDIDRAIGLYEELQNSCSPDHSHFRVLIMKRLARCYDRRSEFSSTTDDLDLAIEIQKQVLEMNPGDEGCIHNFALCLRRRWTVTGVPQDIQQSVELLETLALLDTHSTKPYFFAELGVTLSQRFLETANPEDLRLAVQWGRRAMESINHVEELDKPHIHFCLSKSLVLAFWQWGRTEDLEDAIRLSRGALDGRGQKFDKAVHLHHYGCCLVDRFNHTGALQDLEEAQEVVQQAMDLESGLFGNNADVTSRAHRTMMVDMSLIHSRRFDTTGDITELNFATDLLTKCLQGTPEHTKESSWVISRLAQQLLARDRWFPASENIEKAIEEIEQLHGSLSANDFRGRGILTFLSQCYTRRFIQTSSMDDLDRAIGLMKRALVATPIHHHYRPRILAQLAEQYRIRSATLWEQLGTTIHSCQEASTEAVKYAREARTKSQSDSIDYNDATVVLAKCLHESFQQSSKPREDISCIDEAIGYFEYLRRSSTTQNVSETRPSRACFILSRQDSVSYYLGRAYTVRSDAHYDAESRKRDLHNAITAFTISLTTQGDPPLQRILSGCHTAQIHAILGEWAPVVGIWREVLQIVPVLSPRSLSRSDQIKALQNLQGVSRVATSHALHSGVAPTEALEILELGRGIMANFLLDARIAPSLEPGQASALIQARSRVNAHRKLTSQGTSLLSVPRLLQWADNVRSAYSVERDLQEAIAAIEADPKSKGFLGPPRLEEIQNVMGEETIVMVNVSQRSDAFIIKKRSHIQVITLTDLIWDDVEWWASRLKAIRPMMDLSMLAWLWKKVALPILQELSFLQSTPNNPLPRIVWIMTGPLSHFPMHAAGIYNNGSPTAVMDYAISSYSISTRAFVLGKKEQNHTISEQVIKRAVLVAMGQTPGFANLPSATIEVESTSSVCRNLGLDVIHLSQCGKSAVLEAISDCSIFHFAGHGRSDILSPENSGLILEDASLTVLELLDHSLEGSAPFLGFLSACLTGANDVDSLMDEGIHLVSAFQLIGFRHTIGTLWQVEDRTCIQVAREVYKQVAELGIRDDAVYRGLHEAVLQLRNAWVEGNFTERGPSTRYAAVVETRGQITGLVEDDVVLRKRSEELCEARARARGQRHASLRSNRKTGRLVTADWIPFIHFGP